jgi:hypothetical protein
MGERVGARVPARASGRERLARVVCIDSARTGEDARAYISFSGNVSWTFSLLGQTNKVQDAEIIVRPTRKPHGKM